MKKICTNSGKHVEYKLCICLTVTLINKIEKIKHLNAWVNLKKKIFHFIWKLNGFNSTKWYI